MARQDQLPSHDTIRPEQNLSNDTTIVNVEGDTHELENQNSFSVVSTVSHSKPIQPPTDIPEVNFESEVADATTEIGIDETQAAYDADPGFAADSPTAANRLENQVSLDQVIT